MDDIAFTVLSFSALLYLFLFLSFFTGLLHAQSGGGAARLKLTRNVTASSNPPSNMQQQTFTWPNKSKCLVVLYLTLFTFPNPSVLYLQDMIQGSNAGAEDRYSFLWKVRIHYGAHPPLIRSVSEPFSGGFLRPPREADHSTQSTVKVKNQWSYISTSCICRQGLDTESFTFYREYCKEKDFPAPNA